ncbi:MAG: YdcH family protein [Rhodospirillales bacterium]|nr:YdcH family protein [Rhodospirillales bacterium]
MAMDDRVEALRAKHARLEHEIEEESHRPLPDTSHVSELKREKLKIKDEIERITH